MTTLKELRKALEGFDENLDVRFRMMPIHVGEFVDGHEAGDILVEQKTYLDVTYCYPLTIRKPQKEDKRRKP